MRKNSSDCGNRGADGEVRGYPGVQVCEHLDRLPRPVTTATILTPASNLWVVISGDGDGGVLDRCSDTDKN